MALALGDFGNLLFMQTLSQQEIPIGFFLVALFSHRNEFLIFKERRDYTATSPCMLAVDWAMHMLRLSTRVDSGALLYFYHYKKSLQVTPDIRCFLYHFALM